MSTILLIKGWRFFFYANEGNEPIHIHCKNAEKECKFWLNSAHYEISEAYSYSMSQKDSRIVKEIIYKNFEYIEKSWQEFKDKQK